MMRPWLRSFACVITGVLACTLDTGGVGEGTGDGSGSSSSTGVTTDPMTTAETSSASADGTSTTGVGETGPGETSTGGGTQGTTTDPDTSGTAGASEDSSSSGPPDDDYPACMADDECPDPYTLCWPPEKFGTPNFCTLPCGDAAECPVPSSGTATPVCEGPPDTDICVLDCTDAECPTGMTCVDVFGDGNFLRCSRE